MKCLFCDISAGKKEAHLIYEDKTHIAIMDKYPIQMGHSLVIPKEHHEKITDMPTEGVSSLFSKVPIVAQAILKATGADGFNIGQNNGIAANQIIPHVHVHIIPRYEKMNNPWKRRMIATDEELKKLSDKIKGFIELR
ncbi:MAG: HIT family protein [Thaumarchaeota archaeon]|nr:HIT family protein [Nitrososphaerota archaeon]